MYAILSHGGRQYRVSAGDRLVVDRLDAEIGSVIALAPVLLTGGDGAASLGEAVEGMRVAATVVGHPRGPKLRIFKYKAKKRYRRAAGHRSDLTEVRIELIVSKGDDLPAARATAGATRRRRAAPAGNAEFPPARRVSKAATAKRAAPARKPASRTAATGAKRAPASKGGASTAIPKRATTAKKEPDGGA